MQLLTFEWEYAFHHMTDDIGGELVENLRIQRILYKPFKCYPNYYLILLPWIDERRFLPLYLELVKPTVKVNDEPVSTQLMCTNALPERPMLLCMT